MKGKLTLSICLFWTLFDTFTFLGEKAKLVTAPVKIFIRLKIGQCSSPQKSNIIFEDCEFGSNLNCWYFRLKYGDFPDKTPLL